MDPEKTTIDQVQQAEPALSTSSDEQRQSKVDGGRDAWIALAGAFVLEAVIWGLPGAFGVFQEYYSALEPFKSQSGGLPAISTTANGIMYLASPVIGIVLQRCPQYDRLLGLLGLAIMTAALTAASFSNSTVALIGTQGALYAVGGLTAYFPAIYVVDGWFVARKGFAFGVVLTGTGVGGAVLPFLCQWLLKRYGFRTTLRVWTVIMVILVLPCVLILKRRKGATADADIRPSRNLSFLRRPPFWIFQLGNVCMSLSFFLPSIYIPSFATSIGLPSFAGPLAVCLMNVAACFGYLLHGYLVDRLDVTLVIALSSITTSLSFLVFWGLTTSQGMLYAFAILWGISGGGYAATWSGTARSINKSQSQRTSDDDQDGDSEEGQGVDTGFVISLMCAGKGVGVLVAGPISELLVREGGLHAGWAYGGIYGNVIVFAGVMALLGGLAAVGRGLRLL